MRKADNQGCIMVGMLDIKGQDQCRRVYSVDGISPTLTTSGGGQREVKIFDTKRLRVRRLTPKEYGILQAFPMDDWKQVVSDSQAYKQFGNAVTTTVFTAIAAEIANSIYAAEESEELNMEDNKEFTGMNPPEETTDGAEKETDTAAVREAVAETATAAGEAAEEETNARSGPGETAHNIQSGELAFKVCEFLYNAGFIARACANQAAEHLAKHIEEEMDGLTIGNPPEALRNWEAAEDAVKDMLSKYTPGGYLGKIIYPVLLPLKERLEAGERTADLYNAIVEATR